MEIGWFTKPFITPNGASGIALDGGEKPLLSIEVPELSFGPDLRHPLHLALLIDWQSEPSLSLLREIYAHYENAGVDAWPPLRLTLLPVTSSPESSELATWISYTYLLSGEIATFPDLVREWVHRETPMAPADLQAFLRQAEPEFVERVGLMTDPAAESIEATHAAAEAQLRRNAALLELRTIPQLTSIHQVLTSAPGDEVLQEFFTAAMAYQDAYLSSPAGLSPIAPDFGCHCQDPSHAHQSWKLAIASRFPGQFPLPELPVHDSESSSPPPPEPPAGPQIQFSRIVHATEPPQTGKPAVHTLEFDNIGGDELEIHEILINSDRIILQDWDRRVPPGARGSFTVEIHHPQTTGSAQSIWIRTNSIEIVDINRGHEVILRIPATPPP